MAKKHEGCVQPAGGPVLPPESETPDGGAVDARTERSRIMTARVGQPAPDFEASAYVDGEFRNIKLSDYRGKWVVLCFYPGDFTFV